MTPLCHLLPSCREDYVVYKKQIGPYERSINLHNSALETNTRVYIHVVSSFDVNSVTSVVRINESVMVLLNIPPTNRCKRRMYDVLLWVLRRHFYAMEYCGFAGSRPIDIKKKNTTCIVQ